MTDAHDPLCKRSKSCTESPYHDHTWRGDCVIRCDCSLIRAVRAAAVDEAIQRVERLVYPGFDYPTADRWQQGQQIGVTDALAALAAMKEGSDELDPVDVIERTRSDWCTCATCASRRGPVQWMVVCETCGNKRCPHATHHTNPCTGSNEPGQAGSAYSPKGLTDDH